MKIKPLIIGAVVMLAIWALMPVVGSIAATNSYKIDWNDAYVAVYPSVYRGMQMMDPLYWVLSVTVAIGAGVIAGAVADNAKAGQKIVPSVLVGLVATVGIWFMMFLPATAQQDFTHYTMEKSEFSDKVAAKGGYDALFFQFNQEDPLYNKATWGNK